MQSKEDPKAGGAAIFASRQKLKLLKQLHAKRQGATKPAPKSASPFSEAVDRQAQLKRLGKVRAALPKPSDKEKLYAIHKLASVVHQRSGNKGPLDPNIMSGTKRTLRILSKARKAQTEADEQQWTGRTNITPTVAGGQVKVRECAKCGSWIPESSPSCYMCKDKARKAAAAPKSMNARDWFNNQSFHRGLSS